MFSILQKRELAPEIFLVEVEAPRIAKSAKPGQFVIVRAHERGERIPLTIAGYDAQRGTILMVIQAIGVSTRRMQAMAVGDRFADVAGPLGQPSEFVAMPDAELKQQRLLFIAGGVGAAPILPQVEEFHRRGAHVEVILGARNANLLILKDELQRSCDALHLTTDDGSAGRKGLVTDMLNELVANGNRYTHVITIGPMVMMKFVARAAKALGLPAIASLNTLMVDGTGMCGACRVTVGGKTRFTCVDGPEFDAHQVDFDEALRRLTMYKTQEGQRLREAEQRGHICKIGRNS